MTDETAIAWPPRKPLGSTARLRSADDWLCRYWLPTGFCLLLIGLFVMPSRHDFKILINWMLLLPALFAVFAVPRWWREVRRERRLLSLVGVYLAYLCLNALLQNGADGRASLQWSFYILLFLCAAGLRMRIDENRVALLLWAAVLAATGAAVHAIGRDWLAGALLAPGYRLAGYGALYNALRSGHLFGLMLVIALWCALAAPLAVAQRRLAWACVPVLCLAVLLTGSRSPLFALALVALLVFASCPARWRLRWLAICAALAVVIALMFGTALVERGLSLRPQLWEKTLLLIAENPLLGVGLGRGMLIEHDGLLYHDPHNVFLAALYYGGVLGLAAFGALFGYAFWRAWQQRAISPQFRLAALLQLFGIATLQFDGGSLIGRPTEFWLLYWLPVALTLHAARCRAIHG